MSWTGLQDYLKENASNSISKSDINQFLKDNRINIVEIVKGTGEKLDETQYALYQLEGESENYKEILVTIPKKEERIPVSSIREEVNYERKGYYIETDANGKSFAVRKPKTKF